MPSSSSNYPWRAQGPPIGDQLPRHPWTWQPASVHPLQELKIASQAKVKVTPIISKGRFY